ncbi:MAG TPA: phosphotransferase [Streptosporangiaceae bacterium]|nr:phosphotransferase [Streptosporangiaceae bacterium]
MSSAAPFVSDGLFHLAGDRVLDWDIRRARQVLSGPGVLDGLGDLGPVIAGLLPRLARAADATAALPAGLNHADVTLTNILTEDSSRITGLIDSGTCITRRTSATWPSP